MDQLFEVIKTLLVTVLGAGGAVQFLLTRHDKAKEERRAIAEQKIQMESERSRNMQDLMCAMAQDRIVHLCDRAVEKGHIALDEREIIEDIYAPYEKNGWNNHAHLRVDAMRELPIKEDKKGE